MAQVAAQKKELRRELLRIHQTLTDEGRRASDMQIRRQAAGMPQFQKAGRLFLFVGAGWEVDTWPLIEEALEAGKQVAVPRCLPLYPQPERCAADAQVSLARGRSRLHPIGLRLTPCPLGQALDGGALPNQGSGQRGMEKPHGAGPGGLPGGVMEACLIHSRGDLLQKPPFGLWEPAAEAPALPPGALDFALIPCIACDRSGRRLGRGGGYYDRFLAGRGFTKAAVCRQNMLLDELPHEAHDEKVDYIVTETGVYDCR
jgi:5-formyltetrahydrofolate cyclo-ligase